MQHTKKTVVFFALALLFCFTMPAGAFEIGARGLYWLPTFSADIKVDDSGLVGDRLDLTSMLGVEDDKPFPSVEVFVGHGRHLLTLAYTAMDYSGSAILTQKIVFNGQTFAVGSRVDTSLDLKMFDAQYQYTVLDLENALAGISFNLIGQIKYIDTEAKLIEPIFKKIGTEATLRSPLPMVGVGTHIGILRDILEARAKVTGTAYSGNYLYEVLADLSLTPFPFLDIHAGYKALRLKIDESDVFLDTEFAGPFVGLTVKF
jgi:hypothetical protein